jgi:hypothetical protein
MHAGKASAEAVERINDEICHEPGEAFLSRFDKSTSLVVPLRTTWLTAHLQHYDLYEFYVRSLIFAFNGCCAQEGAMVQNSGVARHQIRCLATPKFVHYLFEDAPSHYSEPEKQLPRKCLENPK